MNQGMRILLGCAGILTLAAIGCDDYDSPTTPQVGTITIDVEPNSISAPWTLTGPNSYIAQGTGDLELPGLAAGDYTVTWASVANWDLPDPSVQTQNLQGGSYLLFRGLYDFTDPAPPEGFVYIAPGTFVMGSPTSEQQRVSEWETQHSVTVTQGFYMSKLEVTEQWWHEVMGGTPRDPLLPKGLASWDMAVQFCNALSLLEGLTPAYTILGPNGDVTWNREANGYRLPTEAEWEYACRAGTTTAYNNGTNCLSSDTEANYLGNNPLTGCPSGTSRWERTNVGSFPANTWGLQDMHGNVWEWVWDGYRADYQNLPGTDPVHDVGPGSHRVLRGGSWGYEGRHCRSSGRAYYGPTSTGGDVGVRPVRSAS